jgi:hypothetical protein
MSTVNTQKESLLTQKDLLEVVLYNPNTGIFYWKKDVSKKIRAYSIAGSVSHFGYVGIGINKNYYNAHRLAWLYCYGVWPTNYIDHINGIKHDNRLSNLRECTNSENIQNQRRAQKGNSVGLLGVYKCTKSDKFFSQIMCNSKVKYLGVFDSKEDAHNAYLDAKREIHNFNSI